MAYFRKMMLMCSPLVTKYNVPGPRYTSYPTVPYWDNDAFTVKGWKDSLHFSLQDLRASGRSSQDGILNRDISLYIHLPFCESMCTFCGCTKRITKNHDQELPYIKSLWKELEMYRATLGMRPRIKQIHLGGGTPTFFSPENLHLLIEGILKTVDRAEEVEFSFEGHPGNTTRQHLETLNKLGFTRVCYGVQDYNPQVQKAINRIQPFAEVKEATEMARAAGYNSVGHDIIYGLPFQTLEHIEHTIDRTLGLMPDRIAFYSYAHVPWVKGTGQRGFSQTDLPSAEIKRLQYEHGKKRLEQAGYVEIGMDHFALKTDSLYQAQQKGGLHRNFMGYCSSRTDIMIGLGVSAISDSWLGFAQNVKSVEEYHDLIAQDILPVYRGHILTTEDLALRKHILNLMCYFETTWDEDDVVAPSMQNILAELQPLQEDGLIETSRDYLRVLPNGRAFVRNVCMSFDFRLKRKKPETRIFSMTV